ncbi:MAG: hypothetical protein OXI05_06645 [Bacteroidota bacterium]|nr:hypothetical protein [Bacteroidota bacterium]MDE2645497.1 hypothetical protein [Bacteroidota bacterium]
MKFFKISNHKNTVRRGIQAYNGQLSRYFDPEILSRINTEIESGEIKAIATEKLDGENFKMGWREGKFYIGQRSSELDDWHKHPQAMKFSEPLVAFLEYWKQDNPLEYVLNHSKTSPHSHLVSPIDADCVLDIAFFGELVGNSMQRRFTWDFDGLDVFFYDMHIQYVENGNLIRLALGYDFLKYVFMNKIGFPSKCKLVPLLKNVRPLREILELDPNFAPVQPTKANNEEGVSEGYVISPYHPTTYPWYLKVKSKPFMETKVKKTWKEPLKSEYAVHVTEERLHHVLQGLLQEGAVTEEELDTVESLGKTIPLVIKAMMEDIQDEEGCEFAKEDRKIVSSLTVQMFKHQVITG